MSKSHERGLPQYEFMSSIDIMSCTSQSLYRLISWWILQTHNTNQLQFKPARTS